MNAELEPVRGAAGAPRPSATLRRRYGSWWLVLLSTIAWLVLSGILLRLIGATGALVLLAAVFLLSISDEFLDRARYGFPPRRRLAGHGLAAAMALLLALLLARLHGQLSPAAGVLFLVLAVIAAALAGGLIPAVIEAVAGSLLLRLLVTTQSGKPAIAGVSDASILGVLVVLAVVVGVLAEGAAPPGRRMSQAAEAARLTAEADRIRAGLVAAYGHDLRLSLDSAKSAVSSLRSPGLQLTLDDHDQLLATVEESLGQLARLAASLPDVSRPVPRLEARTTARSEDRDFFRTNGGATNP